MRSQIIASHDLSTAVPIIDAMTSTIDCSSAGGVVWEVFPCAQRWGGEGERRAQGAGSDGPAGWIPATVPGLITLDLLAAGRISDPYYANQGPDCRWIEERDAAWRARIELPAEFAGRPLRLVCDQIDTVATVFLDGVEVVHHANQFRRLVSPLPMVGSGVHTLSVAVAASMPAAHAAAGGRRLPAWNQPWERLWIRKAQCGFGWDWASRIPVAGICGPMRIEAADGLWAGDLQLEGTPELNRGGTIRARLPLDPLVDLPDATAVLLVDGVERARAPVPMHAKVPATAVLVWSDSGLAWWWPVGEGAPALHAVEVRIIAEGRVRHVARGRCGVRRIELVLDDAAAPNGQVFQLRINGRRVWVRGENWIPMDYLHTRPSDAEQRRYLGLLSTGGVNLLRIWGGGIIERQGFYDACDELGLLIWHDFPFACGIYPEAPDFLAEVEKETRDLVMRLRSHPSIALWCGNNENEMIADLWDPEKRAAARRHPIFYDILPRVVAELDPQRPWWPGSPASRDLAEPANSPHQGDRHAWDVWFNWGPAESPEDISRLCSESGAQSFPQRESLESMMSPDDVWTPGSNGVEQGANPGALMVRHGAQLEKLFARSAEFHNPVGIDAAIASTQAFQAEVLESLCLAHRSRAAWSGGLIVWNYTSCWPSICWALIDGFRRPKQAFYTMRRAFAPLTVGIRGAGDTWTAHASRIAQGASEGHVRIELRRLSDGAVIAATEGRVVLEGIAAVEVCALTLPQGLDRAAHALVATLVPDDPSQRPPWPIRHIRYLVRPRDVRLAAAPVEADRRLDGSVALRATAWTPRVGIESWEAPALFDDNHIDMLPGEERILHPLGEAPHTSWLVAGWNGRRCRLQDGRTLLP
jgi:beta-mannosidase